MSVTIDDLMDHLEENMMKTQDHMMMEFNAIRTGKASPALVEGIMVDYYGTPTRLKELAGITSPEARMLVIQPWDTQITGLIEKAIIASNVGISPVNDGRILRLPVPELSEDRRQQLTKQVKTLSEDSRIAIRNIRREGNEIAKKAQKKSEITEDDLKKMLDDIQKMTDNYIKQLDNAMVVKEKELMSI